MEEFGRKIKWFALVLMAVDVVFYFLGMACFQLSETVFAVFTVGCILALILFVILFCVGVMMEQMGRWK